MTGDSGILQPTEVATAYEQRIADEVARFLAGDDPIAEVEEEDSDQDELPAPVDVPAPPQATAQGLPPTPAPSIPAQLSTPALHSECTVADGPEPGYLPEAGQNQTEQEGRATAYQPRMEQDVPAVAQHRVLEALLVFQVAPANELMFTMPESISNPPEITDCENRYTAQTESYQSAHAPGKASRCTSPATFPTVHSKLQPAAHSPSSLLINGWDAVPVGNVVRMSNSEQDPVIQANKAAIFAAVPARINWGALGGISRVASASATVPQRMSKALPTHQIAAAREKHMGAAGSQPPLRQHALAPGPVSVPSILGVKQSASGGYRTSDMLLTQFLPSNRCDPFERGEMISVFLRSWPLPCEGEDLRKVQDTIYSVIIKLYADGRAPSIQNVEHSLSLLSKKCAITRSKSVLQIVAHQPAIYAIWSSAKFHTYIMLRERPVFPKAMNGARQMLRARAESSDLETAVKAARRYTSVRPHMIEISSPVPTHASLKSQMMELSPPAQTNQVESKIMAVLAAAAASSTQVGVERSSGTYATSDAYCPECLEVKWQIPNYGSAVCRGCNAKLLEFPTHEEEGYAGKVNEDYDEQDFQHCESPDCAPYDGADYPQEDEDEAAVSLATTHHEATDDVHLDVDMSEISGQDRKKSNGIGNSERIANIIREHGYTTLMIRNLSMRMRQKHLLKEIDTSGFQDKYDYCHLPFTLGKGTTSGAGYAFVNFEVVEDAAQFVMKWHGQRRMGVYKSNGAIHISHAKKQGKDANAVNWLPRGWRIRNPELRPFIKGRCEALEEHERKKAIRKLDASAQPSLPPGLVLNPSSAEETIGKCDTEAVNSLPPGLVQQVPMTSPAPPGLVACPGSASSIGADEEPAGLENHLSCRGH